jgi:tripartite-type tricarboxylate transporter receptor subunit TctC
MDKQERIRTLWKGLSAIPWTCVDGEGRPNVSFRAANWRGLAVTTAKRTPAVPHLPPIAEAGVPGFDVSSWYAFFAPARTPPEIIRKMHADTVAALGDRATKERLEQLGVVVVGSTPAELAAFLKAEMDKWAPVIKEAGITIRE